MVGNPRKKSSPGRSRLVTPSFTGKATLTPNLLKKNGTSSATRHPDDSKIEPPVPPIFLFLYPPSRFLSQSRHGMQSSSKKATISPEASCTPIFRDFAIFASVHLP